MTRKDDAIRLGSPAEDLFIEIFSEVFGPENTRYIIIQLLQLLIILKKMKADMLM